MANNLPCGQCVNYWAILKGTREGGYVKQSRGHCLARSVYPKNKPGNPVYPPGAKLEDLPNNVAKIAVVHEKQVESSCNNASQKKG